MQLFNGEVTVGVGVDLLEEDPEVVDFLLRELGGDVGHYHCFELNLKRTTFEKLEKFRIFLKSIVNFV